MLAVVLTLQRTSLNEAKWQRRAEKRLIQLVFWLRPTDRPS